MTISLRPSANRLSQHRVCVTAKKDLLTYGGVFTSDVIDHDPRHQNRDDVDKTCC